MKDTLKILIVGRSGTGKDYLGNELQKHGCTGVKSYTTRPRRSDNEDTHIFITPSESDSFSDKAAVTVINNYEYFATKQQVEDADYYLVDPKGLRDVTAALPDTSFLVVYMKADPDKTMEMAINRASDPEKEKMVYQKRQESEDAQFREFEYRLCLMNSGYHNHWLGKIHNICAIIEFQNDYAKSSMQDLAGEIMKSMKQFQKIMRLLPAYVATGDVFTPEQGRIRVYDADDTAHDDSYAVFAGQVLFSDEGRLLMFDSLLLGAKSSSLAGRLP